MKFGNSEFQDWKHAFAKRAININHHITLKHDFLSAKN